MAALAPDIPQVEVAIVQMTNAFRAEQGLPLVVPNARLNATARYFARYLATRNKFAHEADGRKPHQRATSHGYKYCQVAENLALNLDSRGFRSRQLAGLAVTGWKNSPGHRRNMLLPHVTEIGVAVAKAPFEPKYISVQLFGRPVSMKYSFRVENFSRAKVSYTNGKARFQIRPREIATHQVCFPVTVTFKSGGGSFFGFSSGTAIKGGRFRARGGDVFSLRGRKGSLRVERRNRTPPGPAASGSQVFSR